MTFLEFLEPFLAYHYSRRRWFWFTTKHRNARNKPKTEARKSLGRWILIAPALMPPATLLSTVKRMQSFEILKGR
jgi:hypothetical protein